MSNLTIMYSSKTDMWETPQYLFDELDSEFHFTLDVCAVEETTSANIILLPSKTV